MKQIAHRINLIFLLAKIKEYKTIGMAKSKADSLVKVAKKTIAVARISFFP